MSKICACCRENMSDHEHELISEKGEAVIVCNSCLLYRSITEKRYGVWFAYMILDGVEHFKE